jgi:hypothetical protein
VACFARELTRREELDENGLSGDSVVPSFGSQLHGIGDSQEAEEGSNNKLHGGGSIVHTNNVVRTSGEWHSMQAAKAN